jgi:outer membrane biosynthesis protein TonB
MAQKETKQQVKPQIATSTEKISNIKTNKDNPSPIIEKKAAVAESKVNSSNEIISTDNSSLSSSSAIRDNSIVENKDNGIVENAVPLAATEDENAKPINVDVKSDAQQFTATNDLTKEEVTTNTTAAVNAVPQASRLDKVVLKKTNEQDIKSNSYPVIGWNEYQNYINNNIRKTIENSSLTIKGAVVLGFKVNKKGKPQGIRIIQSLSEACDKEAIRLIETGPEWKKADNKMVNYSIIF